LGVQQYAEKIYTGKTVRVFGIITRRQVYGGEIIEIIFFAYGSGEMPEAMIAHPYNNWRVGR
jgi:hypothetical protein